MTNPTKEPTESTWPDTVYVTRSKQGQLQASPVSPRLGAFVQKYVSADIAAARDLDIIHATLEACKKAVYSSIEQTEFVDDETFSGIDPATILEGLK